MREIYFGKSLIVGGKAVAETAEKTTPLREKQKLKAKSAVVEKKHVKRKNLAFRAGCQVCVPAPDIFKIARKVKSDYVGLP